MNDLTLTITDLKTKVEKLVNLHHQLKLDKEQIVSEKENLLKTIEEQKITIESLQKNNEEFILNKTEEQKKFITDTQLRIIELVQEVDNCITLLK